ncbi:MAG: 23S rRNA (adenine(2503)-C(2))-methyltransferase RlmN [Gemmatimonadales bacterium]|nr:MAG: 23S rRNA (adenine(2503)-C(2))-methyltransferase RlmN [Gemmatimonadales bacterium]
MTSTPDTPRTDLLSLVPGELDTVLQRHFAERRQPSFRATQVREWVHDHGVSDFQAMTNLPQGERDALEARFFVEAPEAAQVSVSTDGTTKHLWQMRDGELIESVLIPTSDRLTLCLSSQAGCAMGCTFCATGWGGFGRQLTAGEIVAQFREAGRWARERGRGPITNVVFMGMGEPLANRKAVHPALTILNSGLGLGARRITVSTVGVVPGIRELASRPEQFGLAISLHSPEEALRAELIPLEKRHPLPELMDAIREFRDAGGRRITFEYTMIRDRNDAPELAPKLARMALDVGAFVNLIPFNPIPYQDWLPSRPDRVEHFRATLEEAGVAAAVREPRGRDIDAACGQLRANALVQLEDGKARRPRARAATSASGAEASAPSSASFSASSDG